MNDDPSNRENLNVKLSGDCCYFGFFPLRFIPFPLVWKASFHSHGSPHGLSVPQILMSSYFLHLYFYFRVIV